MNRPLAAALTAAAFLAAPVRAEARNGLSKPQARHAIKRTLRSVGTIAYLRPASGCGRASRTQVFCSYRMKGGPLCAQAAWPGQTGIAFATREANGGISVIFSPDC